MTQEKWMLRHQDSFEKHFEKMNMIVVQQENLFVYEYESALGLCKIILDQERESLLLERQGEEGLEFRLVVGEKTEMRYQNSLYQNIFLVEGISCKGDLNFLEFSYRLLEETGETINEIQIQMKRRS